MTHILLRTPLLLLLLLVAAVGLPATGQAKDAEPPGGGHLQGPAILGTLIGTFDGVGTVTGTVTGSCKGQPVNIPFNFAVTPGAWATSTAADLEGTFDQAVVPECYGSFSVTVIINTVLKFTRSGNLVTAEVIVLSMQ